MNTTQPLDVITFGETMIRLSPPGRERLESSETLEYRIGGSESNTAIALARLGRRTAWWSRLVSNAPGRKIASEIARWGVDTSLILWTSTGRVGVYFIEFGAPPRPHNVTYDRANSAVSLLTPDMFDWTHLERARHLHLTGITVALSESCAATVLHAAQEARRRGLSVSMDVNYRFKLWSPEQARQTLSGILPSLDILICALSDAAEVFGLTGSAEEIARAFQHSYGIPKVVLTMGGEGALALEGEQMHRCAGIPATEVDRVGAGDAFDAGVLHGFLDGDLEKGLRYGAAMASLKHTIPGDLLIASREEIEAVMRGGPRGIQR